MRPLSKGEAVYVPAEANFEELVNRYYRDLYRFALASHSKPKADAAD